jgi:tetratricopeptide (TPR) repeat protein
MLDTIRKFVAERLAARRDLLEIQRRHADYYRALAEQADRPVRSFGQNDWVERLKADRANVTAAERWYLANDPESLPHLLWVLMPFRVLWPSLRVRDVLVDEARSLINGLLPCADSLDPQARAELLSSAEVTALEASDIPAAVVARDRLVPLLDKLDDPYLQAVSELLNSWTAVVSGDIDRALREAAASLERFRAQDEPLWTGVVSMSLGSLETAMDRYDDADRHLTETRDLAERFDSGWLAAASRIQLGLLAVARSALDEAGALFDEVLNISVATDNNYNLILCLGGFAHLALVEGDAERAAMLAGAARGLRRRAGLEVFTALTGEVQLVAQIRQALDADTFDRAFAAGSRLNRDAAVEAIREGRGAVVRAS